MYCKNDERLKTCNDDDDDDDDDYVTQVVQEYERAVIFRLGRLLSGGTKGPGSVSVCPRPTYDDARLTVIFRDKKTGARISPFRMLLELRMVEVVVTTEAVRRAKLQSNRHHCPTNQHPAFYRPDAIRVPNHQCLMI